MLLKTELQYGNFKEQTLSSEAKISSANLQFMKPEVSLLSSQQPATCPCPELR